jgi:hypothetical protein
MMWGPTWNSSLFESAFVADLFGTHALAYIYAIPIRSHRPEHASALAENLAC